MVYQPRSPAKSGEGTGVGYDEVRRYLEKLYGAAVAVCNGLHRAIDDYERDFYLENTGDDISPENRVRLPDLANTVTFARNILLNAGFNVSVDRPADVLEDKTKAGMVSDFLTKVVNAANARAGRNQIAALIDMMKFGVGALYVQYDPTVTSLPIPSSFVTNPPIRLTAVDPRNVVFMPGGPVGRFSYVIYRAEETLEHAARLALEFDNGTQGEAWKQLDRYFHAQLASDTPEEYTNTLLDYWGWHYIDGAWVVVNAVAYGKAILRPFTVMEGYQHLPWVIAPAQETEAKQLERRFLPITYHGRPIVRNMERLQARMDLILDKIASMPFVLRTSLESPQPPEIEGGAEYVVELKPGQSFEPPPYGTLPRDLWPRMELEQRRAELSLLPSAIMGVATETSGYSLEQLQEGGRMRLQEPRENLEFAMEQMFYVISGLVAYYHGEEIVYRPQAANEENVLFGRDLEGWTIEVKWNATLPGDELRRIAMAQQVVGGKLLSRQTALERYLNHPSPAQEIQRLVVEDALVSDPATSREFAQRALVAMGVVPDKTAAMQEALQEAYQRAQSLYQQALANGATEEQARAVAEEYMQNFVAGFQQAAGMGVNVPQPVSPQQQTPQPPTPPERAEPQPEVRQSGIPAGNPADPGAALAELARRLRSLYGVPES